jgi:hypothetical protein
MEVGHHPHFTTSMMFWSRGSKLPLVDKNSAGSGSRILFVTKKQSASQSRLRLGGQILSSSISGP